MGKKMHYYSFNVGDYIKDTSHLSLIEDLAYRRLIDLYYTTESPIDPNIKAIARKIRMSEHEQVIETILGEFFTQNTDGFWENKRCQNDLDLIYKKSQKARESAKARWSGNKEAQKESERNADGMRTHSERNADGMRTHSERNADGMLHNTQYTRHNTQDTIHNTQDTIHNTQEPKKRTFKKETTLAEYLEQCKQAGVEALQDGSEAHTVSDGLGLSDDMLATAWFEFKRMMIESGKKYASWVKAFANYVRKNYMKIWYFHDNAVFWTNDGKGLCKLHLGYMPDNLNV
jgi:uncharacterized protein YdaU (DUF1376 family)